LWQYSKDGKSGKDTTDSIEGSKIKEMVDCHIEKMIAILRQKAQHEKESLTKTLADYKQQLEKAKQIEKREHANGNITVVTNKNTVLFVLITSQFYFRDDIFSTLKLMICCAFLSFMKNFAIHTKILFTVKTKVCTGTRHAYLTTTHSIYKYN
jgi:hypothetical protein